MSLDPRDSPALTALTELLRGATRRPTAAELDGGLGAVRARLTKDGVGARGHRRTWLAIAGVSLLLMGAALVWRSRAVESASSPVAVSKVVGGRLLEGGYLAESGRAGVELRFNEGSRFVLTPGSRGRVRAVSKDGARLTVEHGTGSFEITPSQKRRWSVEAGPFVVTVTGTDFSVSWDPVSERFELRLRRGRVVVSGPVLGDDLALRAGQNLSVNLSKAETIITETRPEDAPAGRVAAVTSEARVVQPEPPVTGSSVSTPAGSSSVPPAATPGERGWRDALASGKWDRVLLEVEREGVDGALQTASSEDLLALADAARYRRRADLARAALLAHRRRFPGSADTSFLLGRVEELRPSGRTDAVRWYDEYLVRAPAGTYAAEALGRKMILTSEAAGPNGARLLADEYLRRFPKGSYAGAARALLEVR